MLPHLGFSFKFGFKVSLGLMHQITWLSLGTDEQAGLQNLLTLSTHVLGLSICGVRT